VPFSISDIVFGVSSLVAVLSAVRVVTHKKLLYCALYLVLLVLATAAIVLQLGGQFLAAVLVLVYAGAIIVVYIFVIMLAHRPRPSDASLRRLLPAAAAGAVLAWSMVAIPGGAGALLPLASSQSNVSELGRVVLIDYVVVLELAGVLLLAAVIGAIALARKAAVPEEQERQAS
jgi:NADH-quinone oxidoreductase subunit J